MLTLIVNIFTEYNDGDTFSKSHTLVYLVIRKLKFWCLSLLIYSGRSMQIWVLYLGNQIIFPLLWKDISCKTKPRWMRFRVSIVVSPPSVYSENGFPAHSVTANCRAILPEEAEWYWMRKVCDNWWPMTEPLTLITPEDGKYWIFTFAYAILASC